MRRQGQRIVATLFADQSLVVAGAIATATVLPIVATELTGRATWAGVPGAVSQLAQAGAALLWGILWDRFGRRSGIAVAMVVGMGGALLGAVSVEAGSMWLLLVAVSALGAAQAGGRLSRFVAAEVSPPSRRGSAIALVVWGGTAGAIGGPLLIAPASALATSLELNALTGPILMGLPLLLVATAIALLGLRPEPLELSRRLASAAAADAAATEPAGVAEPPAVRPLRQLLRLPAVIVAIVGVLAAQTVMVMLMGITSLYMKGLDQSLGQISVVFSAHTLGMFAFSPLSGRLVDRVGRGPMLVAGGGLIIAAAIVAPSAPQLPVLVTGLFLLGLGWNFAFVAGSALLADQLTPAERSKTQGVNDLLVGAASALGSVTSGVVFAALGYGVVSLVGGGLMALTAALSLWWTLTTRRPRPLPAS